MALPHHMRADDPAAADPARRRLLQRSSFPRFPSPSSKSTPKPHTLPDPDSHSDDILISRANLPVPEDANILYRWAVLYENQRGITLFSTPFYSPLSLLPSDPDPFTIPTTPNKSRVTCPNLSLNNYPLPDGTWRWVSTAWMVDMRTDRGEVQHDGFEYNWAFRGTNWHAKAGRLGAGAWVRRRRWVRLMMRPANHSHCNRDPSRSLSTPSLIRLPSEPSLLDSEHVSHMWDGTERDWQRVHRLLKQLGRDGRKLELWRTWLGPYAHASDIKGKGKQSDVSSSPSQTPLEKRLSGIVPEGSPPPLPHLTIILRNHGKAVLDSFVFPDSRAQFAHLVKQAGLARDLESCLGRAFSAADVDFWSYADHLDKLVD